MSETVETVKTAIGNGKMEQEFTKQGAIQRSFEKLIEQSISIIVCVALTGGTLYIGYRFFKETWPETIKTFDNRLEIQETRHRQERLDADLKSEARFEKAGSRNDLRVDKLVSVAESNSKDIQQLSRVVEANVKATEGNTKVLADILIEMRAAEKAKLRDK